jgi:hypothetical protein
MLKFLRFPMNLQLFAADGGAAGGAGEGAGDNPNGGNADGNQNGGAGDNGGQGAGAGTGAGKGNQDPGKAPKTFDEEYVKKLRAEAASYRTKASELEAKSKEERQTLIQQLFSAFGIEADPNKEFEKQLQEARAKAQEVEQRANDRLVRAEVKSIAAEMGLVDADAALALMDKSGVKIAEDGSVEGVKEALDALVAAKPYLKQQSAPANIGGGTNPANQSSDGKFYTRAEIERMTPEQINANWDKIQEQMAKGLIK